MKLWEDVYLGQNHGIIITRKLGARIKLNWKIQINEWINRIYQRMYLPSPSQIWQIDQINIPNWRAIDEYISNCKTSQKCMQPYTLVYTWLMWSTLICFSNAMKQWWMPAMPVKWTQERSHRWRDSIRSSKDLWGQYHCVYRSHSIAQQSAHMKWSHRPIIPMRAPVLRYVLIDQYSFPNNAQIILILIITFISVSFIT